MSPKIVAFFASSSLMLIPKLSASSISVLIPFLPSFIKGNGQWKAFVGHLWGENLSICVPRLLSIDHYTLCNDFIPLYE
jgi:hypothetical protein